MGYLQYLRHTLVFLLAAKAYKSKSLTNLGILASIATGLVHTFHPWIIMFVLLAGFYLPSSKFTKLKADVKAKLTVTADKSAAAAAKTGGSGSTTKEGGEGPRSHIQVFANSIVATLLIALHMAVRPNLATTRCWSKDHLVVGIVAQYAAVTADTWSSELGILSTSNPILITTLRPCPKGTNGGVSPLGLGVAIAAGAYIGLLAMVFLPICPGTWTILGRLGFIGFMAGMGLFGSLLDSVLGALFQKSVVNEKGLIIEAEGGGVLELGDEAADQEKQKVISGGLNLLTNNQVNLLMAFLTSVTSMVLWRLVY